MIYKNPLDRLNNEIIYVLTRSLEQMISKFIDNVLVSSHRGLAAHAK